MDGSGTKRKLNTLTITKKIEVIEAVEAGGRQKQQIAADFNIPVSTLSTILKNKDKIRSSLGKDVKRQRPAEYQDVEKCTYKWFVTCRDKNIPISGPLIQQKATHFARTLGHTNFMASIGWLGNFKKRHSITFKTICGESREVNEDACTHWKQNLHITLENYAPNNIFNADETALFFQCLPDKTLTLKSDKCHGGKQSKLHLTILLAANSDGSEKLTPLIIGKYKKPRCFSEVKSLPLDYTSNSRAWMTSEKFSEWLVKLNNKMLRGRRKIVLIVDNCPAHNNIPSLSHVKVLLLPPNTTSKLQPLDLGIIQNFKVLYRKEVLSKIVNEIEEEDTYKKITVLDAIRISDKAWRNVGSQTIANCFRKAGISTAAMDSPSGTTFEVEESAADIWPTVADKLHLSDGITFKAYVDVDAEVETCAEPTEQEIIAECLARNESDLEDENDEDAALPIIKTSDAKRAFGTVRAFIEQTPDVCPDVFAALHTIEKVFDVSAHTSKQTKISDYFT